MNEKERNKYNYFSNKKNNIKDKELNKVVILGGGKVVKTFILHKLFI